MMIVVSVGDGCRGFEDVIMDEVKEDFFIVIFVKIISMLLTSILKVTDLN